MAVNHDKLVKFVKANPEASQRLAAENQGLAIGQLSMLSFCQAKLDAGVVTKAPATGPSVKKLKDVEENRWEMIAVRTGMSVAAVKELYVDAGGKNLGRKPAADKPASSKASGRKPAAPRGKPGAKQGAGKGGRTTITRNRTRRGAANPS